MRQRNPSRSGALSSSRLCGLAHASEHACFFKLKSNVGTEAYPDVKIAQYRVGCEREMNLDSAAQHEPQHKPLQVFSRQIYSDLQARQENGVVDQVSNSRTRSVRLPS